MLCGTPSPCLPPPPPCRGFLTGQIKAPEDLAEDDYRRVGQPRFAGEAFKKVGRGIARCVQDHCPACVPGLLASPSRAPPPHRTPPPPPPEPGAG